MAIYLTIENTNRSSGVRSVICRDIPVSPENLTADIGTVMIAAQAWETYETHDYHITLSAAPRAA